MNTDNVWIVIVLLLVILVGANALMFAIIRGFKGTNMNWFKNTGKSLRQPWEGEDKSLEELSRRVRELKSQNINHEEE